MVAVTVVWYKYTVYHMISHIYIYGYIHIHRCIHTVSLLFSNHALLVHCPSLPLVLLAVSPFGHTSQKVDYSCSAQQHRYFFSYLSPKYHSVVLACPSYIC